jgi:hypothetical protein
LVKKLFGRGKGRDKAQASPKIYVRRNGSRYIDTDELVQSDKFKETIAEMKQVENNAQKPTRRPYD